MSEKIKSAIEYLEDVFEDVKAMNRSYPDEKFSELSLAIRSLKAWLEVLQELEILIRGCDIMLEDTDDDIQSVLFYGGKKRAYEKAIEVINQKLAEVEK